MVNFSTLISLPGSNEMLFGSGDLNVPQDSDYDCKTFPFDPKFFSDDVRVQLTVTSKNKKAAVAWLEKASRYG